MSDETTKTKKTAHSLQYPVMLVHGFGFRDGKRINYWGRIPKLLEEKGCAVFYGKQDSSGTIEDNALFLKERIEEILRETGAEKSKFDCSFEGRTRSEIFDLDAENGG